MQLKDLIDVQKELKRFEIKLKEAIQRVTNDDFALISGSRETGAVKRAALDLKNELTKITK